MSAETGITLTVNGERHDVACEARTTLADCLRHKLGLTGTHVGCEHGVCGACTVLVDGAPARACLMFAVQAEGLDITTVEGLSDSGRIAALQQAFTRHHALQCGFCTPAMLVSAHALLQGTPEASDDQIREILSGVICRCTGYVPIVAAVREAARDAAPDGGETA